jgi:hypothetical protein
VYVDAQAVFELNNQIGGCMKNEHYGYRRSISFALSVCLIFSGFPLRLALADPSPGVMNPTTAPSPRVTSGTAVQGSGSAAGQLKDAAGAMQGGTDNCVGSPNCSKTFDGGSANGNTGGTNAATTGGQQAPVNQTGHKVEYSKPDAAQGTTGPEAGTPTAAEATSGTSAAGTALLGVGLGLGLTAIVVGVVAAANAKYCGSWSCTTYSCAQVFGGGVYSGSKSDFTSMTDCESYLGPVFGKSCHKC